MNLSKYDQQLASVLAEVDNVRSDVKDLAQRMDEVVHKVSWSDDDRQRLEAGLATLGNDMRVQDRDWRERTDALLARIDASIAGLIGQAESRHHLIVEHVRRSVSELQQQLVELEGGSA